MSIFGKKASEYFRFARIGVVLILLMGVIRFVVGISGVPYEQATNYVSMTILTLLLFLVYGYLAAAKGFGTYRHLLPLSYSLAGSMYGFIVLAILTEGLTGLPGYFHVHSLHALAANPNTPTFVSQGIPTLMNVPTHIAGQILAMFIFGFVGWGLTSISFSLTRKVGVGRVATT